MKLKFFLSLLGAAVIALLVWGLPPAKVYVGSTMISTGRPRASVFIANAVGDAKGYRRCMLTGTSFYWDTKYHYSVEYLPGRGMIISDSAGRVLEKLMAEGHEDEAYQQAQAAFEKLQAEAWASSWETGHRLMYPLKINKPEEAGTPTIALH